MKLATLKTDRPDGRLMIVSQDLDFMSPARQALTLQEALERWNELAPALQVQSEALNAGVEPSAVAYDASRLAAPLPRAWQWLDGSAFRSHAELTAQAFKLPHTWHEPPLMYQGMSHQFLSWSEDVPFASEEDGIDFEGEFGVITDAVPARVSVREARAHIKLVVQINDWSLRVIGREEMSRGFGWVRAKPACSVAPVAVTPDELGEAWADARVGLKLGVWRNGEAFGSPSGGEMAFGFDELIAHAAYSRRLSAGTVIGSGTVSNAAYQDVGSSCIVEKRGAEILEGGDPLTPFLRFGERVRMEAAGADGRAMFGALDQRVAPFAAE